ncbi:MAG: UBP-type zinc finger domain-containing protein [Burkholderiales bacterium]|nr:UBP-type zinc finger domain-containing protein [Anaerolineae bacterium]
MERLFRLRYSKPEKVCTHRDSIQVVTPSGEGCKECLEMGDTWVHLRLCLTCGHVGCCDNSKNKHATQHYLATQHPIIRSFQPDETWMWCYVDEIML